MFVGNRHASPFIQLNQGCANGNQQWSVECEMLSYTNFFSTMQKVLLLFLLCFFGVSLAMAQNTEEATKKNIIKLNYLSPLAGTFNMSYERVIASKKSVQLGVFLTERSGRTSFGITPEVRFYLSDNKPAPRGFFVAPYLRYQYIDRSQVSVNDKISVFTSGFVLGGQWLFSKKFSFEVFGGVCYNIRREHGNSASNGFNLDFIPNNGFGVRFGTTFGIAF